MMKRLFAVKRSTPPSPLATTQDDMATTVGLQPSLLLSPVPHPHPHELIAIVATDDGLVMRPHLPGYSHPVSCICVPWGKNSTVQELRSDPMSIDWKSSVAVYGLVGILDLFNASYLLVITARSRLGLECVFDESRAIYSVKSVHAIPLVKERVQHVLQTIASHVPSSRPLDEDSALPLEISSTGTRIAGNDLRSSPHADPTIQSEVQPSSLLSSGTSTPMSSESLASSTDRTSFWTRLSRRQPTSANESVGDSDEYEPLDFITQKAQGELTVDNQVTSLVSSSSDSTVEHFAELEDRVVHDCIKEYVKGCMYFSYHFDITRSLQNKYTQFLKSRTEESLLANLNALPLDKHPDSKVDPLSEPSLTLPLWRRVNREFWWNEWISKPFLDAKMHSYVLPIVQGHFQVSSFDLQTESDELASRVGYLIASRRSRHRAGLRYQRRGVDEEAHVANFVETETIMRIKRNGIENVFSFVQIRGSVPLFWTQSGYSMKPPPILSPERTSEQNLDAMQRHLQRTIAVYGSHTIVNLAEQMGKESTLTNAYKSYAKRMENKDIRYCEYDFHRETKGMKYENISKLIDELARTFESQGYFWVCDNTLLSKQKGVFRVNCIDCLDRTNVIQSAFARHVLGMQLEAVGLIAGPQNKRSEMDVVFNDVWANNGDTISRAYAGTSALKGDFTRTGKRDLGGLFNDGFNSLARMYSATFSDWFCQAVIDFMLGYRSISVFSEFLLKLQSTDPRELIRLSRIRAEAIASSVSRVLEEGEPLFGGWTLIAPEQLNVKMSDKFEEKVLLLSARALYIVSYDYTLEKVKLYTRIPLGMIVKITKGAYILSPLEEASRDPIQNAGFSITWLNTDLISMRKTSYTYRHSPIGISPKSDSAVGATNTNEHSKAISVAGNMLRMVHTRASSKSRASDDRVVSDDTLFAAFKVLPIGSVHVRNGSRYAEPADDLASATSCKEAVDLIVDTIKKACKDVGGTVGDDFVAEEDIVSVSEAQRTTSLYAKMEYNIKRLLWLGG